MSFNAWLTTDSGSVATDVCDVVVLDTNATNADEWEYFYATTTVDVRTGDHDDAVKQAGELLADAGWRTVGEWRTVPSGYVITVEQEK